MDKLIIPEPTKQNLYNKARELTAHSDIYFPNHVLLVAKSCLRYGKIFEMTGQELDPVICEITGLFHDIGYTEKYEPEEKDHIAKGVRLTPKILEESGIISCYSDRIVDCIRTHDGNLNKTHHGIDGQPKLENIVVNDVDSMALFDWPIKNLIMFVEERLKLDNPIKRIEEHANITFNYIHHDYFKFLAEPKYRIFLEQLK